MSLTFHVAPVPYCNISKFEFSALYKLSLRPDLVITKADKNLGIVLMDTKDYCSEVYRHLNDASTYQKLSLSQAKAIADNFTNEFHILLTLIEIFLLLTTTFFTLSLILGFS